MNSTEPPADTALLTRLVVEGLLTEGTARAVFSKIQELTTRGQRLSAEQICVRKGFCSASEARWLTDPDRPPAGLLPGLSLGKILGRGGQSRVYGAHRLPSGESLAVKLLLPKLARDPLTKSRFVAEGHLLSSLEHPHLVRGFGIFEHDGLVYVLMEWIDGETALERMLRAGPFHEDDALAIVLATARALGALHQRGLVHRDVKPDNVLLGHDGAIKLSDLGLTTDASADAANEVTAGTVQYIAPEQAAGGLDVRSDIYSLGITLFHLSVGSLPFAAGSDEETMLRRIQEELRAPELKGLGISPHLNYFIKKMTARDPAVRYQSTDALVADMEEQLGGRASLLQAPKKVEPATPIPAPTSRGVRRTLGKRPGGRH